MDSEDIDTVSNELEESFSEQILERQVQRLIEVQTYLRWIFDAFLWLTVGTASIWALRSEIELWIAAFTWAAVRMSLVYNRLPMLGLGICIAMTLATLVWQSAIILWGVSPREKRSLINQVKGIREAGKSHPLWRWVCEEKIIN
ncbi:hypothetical protein [Pseudanabaena sp. ABRG5-3]|uniref:hypothetical protein n=1 Tax=Pseudanabaena sp. ABRG5-3 TaxID=685565 RepID=UPI000DC72DE4|nr:hypothetical protein [Pseudanabaena sp. ABRG5-3]BBC26365.1 hypothetical protein ABRG53_4108 [Pseudanabaena sp. ABRG5-3]